MQAAASASLPLTGVMIDVHQAAGCCQTGDTGTDDNNVKLHRFAFHSFGSLYSSQTGIILR